MKSVSKTMNFEKTGKLRSKSKNINYFRDLSSSQIIWGAAKELYRRYDTELWLFVALGSIAYQVWYRLGL